MYNHAPPDYACPFCLLVRGIENPDVHAVQTDIVFQSDVVTAFIGSKQWANNPGHVIVIPNSHFENIYDLPETLATAIHGVARAVALALKEGYACDGTSLRQHNEPAGNQEVWHYHLHVFPRYLNDNLYTEHGRFMPASDRAIYAARLKQALGLRVGSRGKGTE